MISHLLEINEHVPLICTIVHVIYTCTLPPLTISPVDISCLLSTGSHALQKSRVEVLPDFELEWPDICRHVGMAIATESC